MREMKKGWHMKTADEQQEGERSSALEDRSHFRTALPFGSTWEGYQRGKPLGRQGEGALRGIAGGTFGGSVGSLGGMMVGGSLGRLAPLNHRAFSMIVGGIGGGLAGGMAGNQIGSHLATRGLLEDAKTAAYKTVIARYKLSDLKHADIDKLIRGNIIGLKGGDNQGPAEAASDEDRLMRTFRDADSKASQGSEGGEALPSQGGLTL